MSESKGPSTEAIALYTNVFGCVPDTEALEAGDVWEIAHIDAALRRAKAEVWRKAAIEARIESVRKDETSGYQRASRCLADTYDARAAQIEQGEG